jgi:hypothetical protein
LSNDTSRILAGLDRLISSGDRHAPAAKFAAESIRERQRLVQKKTA